MRHIAFLVLLLVLFLMTTCQSSPKKNKASHTESHAYPITGAIDRIDPAIDALIKNDAVIEVLSERYQWTEGPLWIEDGEYLLFSEIPSNSIYKWSEKNGAQLYLSPSGYTGDTPRGGEPGSNGLILDKVGRLVLCQHGDRRMSRMAASINAPQSNFETIVDRFQDQRFNSPNDAIYDSKGNLFFTDPPYGLEGNVDDPDKEIAFQGVYRYSVDGYLTLVTDQMTRPNGLALSPDEKTLYVANSDPQKSIWMAFTLNDDGSIQSEKLFYDATGAEGKGLPDGMKVDIKGNIWATGPGGVWVFDPSGKVLGKINPGEATSNCAFDTEESTLYMTCDDYLMRVKLTRTVI